MRAVALGLLGACLCLAGVTGCAVAGAHLAARRRRSSGAAVAEGRTGSALPQKLSLRGPVAADIRAAAASRCDVYPETGYTAELDLSLPGRVDTLALFLPTYQGPGRYPVTGGGGAGAVRANLSGVGSAGSGWVEVAAGGRGGTLELALGHGRSTERLSGAWNCATVGAAYGPPIQGTGTRHSEALIATGGLSANVTSALVPSHEVVVGAPNCGAYPFGGGSRFNLAMSIELQGSPYLLDVQAPDFQGPGFYYPALTAASLPANSPLATAQLSVDAPPARPGRIPDGTWAAVGGDLHVGSGLQSGRMFVRFLDRAGSSFILSGAWSC